MSARVSPREEAGALVLAVAGELDANSAPELLAEILPQITAERPTRLDLARVGFVSSAGLRALLLAYRRARLLGARITLTGIQPDVEFVMAATGFLDLFDIEERPPAPQRPAAPPPREGGRP
ncbi:STAS domain-containing protein [Actinomadura fibrosa]|uniref:Anti-sigma factor antagonist n=1 Tax=Actinomadura fibrosa TaxID=111802 RepID=A0ABW2XQB4_9ACTN|nr:STAS domain-containing protein [Actinomadura fibrosa]